MCGGTDIVKQDGVFVCQGCGMKYSAEDAKALMCDCAAGTQNAAGQSNEDKLNSLLTLARRARDCEDAVNAAKYYDMIQELDPDSWEALFYSVYFNYADDSWTSKCTMCLKNVFKLIETKVEGFDKQTEAICDVAKKVMLRSDKIAVAARNEMLEKCNSPEYSGILQAAYFAYEARLTILPILNTSLGNLISDFCSNKDFMKLAVMAWKTGINYAVNEECSFDESDYSDIIEKIKKFEPSYVVPQPMHAGYPQSLLNVIRSEKMQASEALARRRKLPELKKEVRTLKTAQNQYDTLSKQHASYSGKITFFIFWTLFFFFFVYMAYEYPYDEEEFYLAGTFLALIPGIIGTIFFAVKNTGKSERIKLLQELIEKWDDIEPANSTTPADESDQKTESSETGIPSAEDLYISDPERVYLLARDVMEDDNIEAYEAALADFESIPDYKNARELAEKCRKRIEELENGSR